MIGPVHGEPNASSGADGFVVAHGPLLLFAAGMLMFVVGVWRGNATATALGGVAVIFAVLLPRIRGDFKVGPTGLQGSLIDREQFIHSVSISGHQLGLPPEKIEEYVEDARDVEPSDLVGLPPPADSAAAQETPRSSESDDRTNDVARKFVSDSLLLQRFVETLLRSSAHARIEVQPAVRVDNGSGPARVLRPDIVATGDKKVVYEVKASHSPNTIRRGVEQLEMYVNALNADEGVLVVPDDARISRFDPTPDGIRIVTIGQLLSELADRSPNS
jgi:hypothetical protein